MCSLKNNGHPSCGGSVSGIQIVYTVLQPQLTVPILSLTHSFSANVFDTYEFVSHRQELTGYKEQTLPL